MVVMVMSWVVMTLVVVVVGLVMEFQVILDLNHGNVYNNFPLSSVTQILSLL